MDPRIDRLKAATEAALEAASSACPELCLRENGLTLFLGKHYADTIRILMLGLNPGLLREETGGSLLASYAHDYELAASNLLVGDAADSDGRRVRYWRNAKRCFGATAALRASMQRATFSFCCPFRTAKWSELTSRQQSVLETHSKPVLQLILNDCQPAAVIVAGTTARDMLLRAGPIADAHVVFAPGQQRWTEFNARAAWGELSVIQLPHFSYFNALDELQACGEWVSGILARRGLTALAADRARRDLEAPRLKRKR
jgi:hypothetical protein